MAVEDHPKWPEWKAALEELIEAKSALKATDNLPKENSARVLAIVRAWLAQKAYDAISDSLD